MGRRNIEDENIRSLIKVAGGKAYSVTLPVDVIRRWKWFTLLNDFKFRY